MNVLGTAKTLAPMAEMVLSGREWDQMDMIKIDLIKMRGDGGTDLITVTLATSALGTFIFSLKRMRVGPGFVLSGATGRSRVELAVRGVTGLRRCRDSSKTCRERDGDDASRQL